VRDDTGPASGRQGPRIPFIFQIIKDQIFLQGRRVRSGVAGVQRNRGRGGLDEIEVSS
jgi:hypothetical protein